jgi:hypothetical protein
MSWLRSWKLCAVRPRSLDGITGWEKRRLRRAAWLIPPGNAFLHAMGAGCRMVGADWCEHERRVFEQTHPSMPAPRVIGAGVLWLPHLPGVEMRGLAVEEMRRAAVFAFAELGRFHRLSARSLHGDPHAANFLFDAEDDGCRIIDFETVVPDSMDAAQGRARDFMILALDLWRQGAGSMADLVKWGEAHGMEELDCPVEELIRRPGIGLSTYWRWLGYQVPGRKCS